MSHTSHIAVDVGSRLAQGGLVLHGALQGVCDGIAAARADRLDAVQSLVAELGRARRQAAAAQAEAAQLQQENEALVEALARSRAAMLGYARELGLA